MFNTILRCRYLLASNDELDLYDNSGAFFERFDVLYFPRSFRGTSKQDRNLQSKLLAELPEIFMWAIGGLKPHYDRGLLFTQPKASQAARDQFEIKSAPLSAFCRKMCNFEPGAVLNVKDLKAAWLRFASDNSVPPRNPDWLIRDIAGLGKAIESKSRQIPRGGERYVIGMDLRRTSQDDDRFATQGQNQAMQNDLLGDAKRPSRRYKTTF